MEVEFYFDPCCPFCWITSRWLLMVSSHRNITIEWKPFSLALKNDELAANTDIAAKPHAKVHRDAHRVLRVMLAAQQQAGTPLIDLYTACGIQHHVAGFELDNELISNVLKEKNLPDSLLQYADDASLDSQLQSYIDQATQVAGQDIGVPTIVFTATDGTQQGFFGPVLQTLPELDEALDLWDGLSKLATNTSFYELKRSRPDGGPDVASTAKC